MTQLFGAMGEAAVLIEAGTFNHESVAQFRFRHVGPVHQFAYIMREKAAVFEPAVALRVVLAQFGLYKMGHWQGTMDQFPAGIPTHWE